MKSSGASKEKPSALPENRTVQGVRIVDSQGLGNYSKSDALSDSPSLLAPGSVRAYKGAWSVFNEWCGLSESPLPATPETIVAYLTNLAQSRKAATLSKHLAAIAHNHHLAGYGSPTTAPEVRRCLRSLRREYGARQTAKAPVLITDVRKICPLLPDTVRGKRDRCLLLVGFAGAFRPSELVGLALADLEFTPQGVRVLLRRSKTDQEGHGRDIAIPYGTNPSTCPVRAVQQWQEVLTSVKITGGPLLRSVNRHGGVGKTALSTDAVRDLVKEMVQSIGLDPVRYGGHSLRAGLATSAAMEGADDRAIMRQTGHRSREMVDRYIREANLWKNNAASRAGL